MPSTSTLSRATKLQGMVDTGDLSDNANSFLRRWCPLIIARAKLGQPHGMSEKQEEWFNDLYEQHFAD